MSTARVTHSCDQCGKEESFDLTASNKYPSLPPATWIKVSIREKGLGGADLCCWGCVEAFAAGHVLNQDRGAEDAS